MGPPNEVTPSFRKTLKTWSAPGNPDGGVSGSVAMADSAEMQSAFRRVSSRHENFPAIVRLVQAVRHAETVQHRPVGLVAHRDSAGDRGAIVEQAHVGFLQSAVRVTLSYQTRHEAGEKCSLVCSGGSYHRSATADAHRRLIIKGRYGVGIVPAPCRLVRLQCGYHLVLTAGFACQ